MNNTTVDPVSFPWEEVEALEKFESPEWTSRILDGMSVRGVNPGEVDKKRREIVVDILSRHLPEVVSRLKRLESSLNDALVGKSEIVRMLLVCSIAQQPMLILGPPGAAKSAVVNGFCDRLGIGRAGTKKTAHTSFIYLLHAFTEPDEILGIVNLESLKDKNDPRFERLAKGSITESEVIFLDELFRSNSALLNALLSIINERRVYEGGVARNAKAHLIFGASNDIPSQMEMKDLKAFYERFIIRMESLYVPCGFGRKIPTEDRRQLLAKGWKSEVDSLRAGYDVEKAPVRQVSCLNDILFCTRAITELWGGENIESPEMGGILQPYHELVTRLSGGPEPICEIDDRKFVKLMAVLRAHSLLARNGAPVLEDLKIFKHIWAEPADKDRLEEEVDDFIASY